VGLIKSFASLCPDIHVHLVVVFDVIHQRLPVIYILKQELQGNCTEELIALVVK